ncbi:hypothetical protein ACB092_01G077600 [Castanea dentata]
MPSISKSLQAILGAPGINGKRVTVLSKDGLTDFMRSIICSEQETKETFYVLDLGAVATLMDRWTLALPKVQPYYAVKCNPNLNFLGAMAALGTNFDCVSQAEIESILSLGVSPDRIIFANPCKAGSHIKYAASVGVNLTTFDSIDEIKKMQKWHPKCDLIIQIKALDDSGACCPLSSKLGNMGSKYGALPEELTVGGISFHIGSASTDSRAYQSRFCYQQAIAAAKTAFKMATKLGMPQMSVLNIGGGFMANSQFDETATVVKTAIQSYFGNYSGLTVIAEPGRFFAESVFTLATNIIGKRIRNELREYWISDGIYGSLNCIILDNAIVKCMPLALTSNLENPTRKGSKTYNSTVFGPTCDALDIVFRGYQLPKLQVDDWLVFSTMAAYTTAAGTNFNGFNTSAIPNIERIDCMNNVEAEYRQLKKVRPDECQLVGVRPADNCVTPANKTSSFARSPVWCLPQHLRCQS